MKSLESAIKSVKENYATGKISSEADSITEIKKILHKGLGWDSLDLRQMQSEFPVGERNSGRVDLVLFDSNGHVFALIEAKKADEISNDSKRRKYTSQLFNYAIEKGARLLILTDGLLWYFFVPGGGADTLLEINLLNDEGYQKFNKDVSRILGRNIVESEKLSKNINEIYEEKFLSDKARKAIKPAWENLLKNSKIHNLISNEVQKHTNVEPGIEDIDNFLKTIGIAVSTDRIAQKTVPQKVQSKSSKKSVRSSSAPQYSLVKVIYKGKPIFDQTNEENKRRGLWVRELVKLFGKIEEDHPGTLEKMRKFNTPNRSNFYKASDGDIEISSSHKEMEINDEWRVNVWLDNKTKLKRIKAMCEFAGLKFKDFYGLHQSEGSESQFDVIVEFAEDSEFQ